MLKMISGAAFTRTLLIGIVVYYTIVLIKYYRADIRRRLTGKEDER